MSVPSHAQVAKPIREQAQPQAGHCESILIEKLNASSKDLKKDIMVYFRTLNMDRPQLLAQPCADYPDEIACLISLVPTFVPPEPQDVELETAENERPEELDTAIDIPDDNVFFFIVDCSGSMDG